jgi:allophanate hydrolase
VPGIDSPLRVRALRRALADGLLDPSTVVEDVLRRLDDQVQPQAWICTASPSQLRARAAELANLAPQERPPLYGIPFAVKDNIDVAGMPTTVGCPAFTYFPEHTATAVQLLLDAGAILVGKTNLDQFATGLTGARSPFGTCTSVLDPELPSGGSSSGSAVVVAGGVVAFSLGTDTAGSGRVPAALNGIVGVKPTPGLVSTAGVFPACRSLDCVSVFAHDVADGWVVLDAIAGVDPADPWSRAKPEDSRSERALPRVGVVSTKAPTWAGDAAQAQAYRAACDRVTAIAATVEEVDLTAFLDAGDLLYDGPWIAERHAVLGDFLAERPQAFHPVTAAALAPGAKVTGAQAFAGMHRLRELASQTAAMWQQVDVLVLPTLDRTFTLEEVAADPLGTNRALGRFTHFANLLDLAVVAVPNGQAPDRRPSGISLVGPAFSDARLARWAHQLMSGEPSVGVGQWSRDDDAPNPTRARLAVVGHHLRGGPRNHELLDRGAQLVATTRTAPRYRLYRLASPNGAGAIPGMVRSTPGGLSIEVEVWDLPTEGLGSLLGSIRAPLGLGQVELEDGSWTTGFLCESYAIADALDISEHGGWRAYLAAAAQPV